jgi:hypothetical protein
MTGFCIFANGSISSEVLTWLLPLIGVQSLVCGSWLMINTAVFCLRREEFCYLASSFEQRLHGSIDYKPVFPKHAEPGVLIANNAVVFYYTAFLSRLLRLLLTASIVPSFITTLLMFTARTAQQPT